MPPAPYKDLTIVEIRSVAEGRTSFTYVYKDGTREVRWIDGLLPPLVIVLQLTWHGVQSVIVESEQ